MNEHDVRALLRARLTWTTAFAVVAAAGGMALIAGLLLAVGATGRHDQYLIGVCFGVVIGLLVTLSGDLAWSTVELGPQFKDRQERRRLEDLEAIANARDEAEASILRAAYQRKYGQAPSGGSTAGTGRTAAGNTRGSGNGRGSSTGAAKSFREKLNDAFGV